MFVTGPDGQKYPVVQPEKANDYSAQRRYALLRDLHQYQTRLHPMQQMGMDLFVGPQAEQNRAQLLSQVDDRTMGAFNRAEGREMEFNRMYGTDRQPMNNARQIRQQMTRAQNSTDAKRLHQQFMDSNL